MWGRFGFIEVYGNRYTSAPNKVIVVLKQAYTFAAYFNIVSGTF